jgi:hypothetical protein
LTKTCKSCGHTLLDFQRVCEKCGALQEEMPQVMPPVAQKPIRETGPLEPAPEQVPPIRAPRPPPPARTQTGPPTGRKIKPLLLASILIVVVVVGAVAVALVWFNPFGSLSNPGTSGSSCTLTTSTGRCQVGNGLYLRDLHVSNTSYSGHPTYLVAFVINNTGTTAVNFTTINFDNQPVINGLPTPGSAATSPFWVTYLGGHVIAPKAELQLALELPRTTSSGAHKVTLVDTAGNQYTFNFNI